MGSSENSKSLEPEKLTSCIADITEDDNDRITKVCEHESSVLIQERIDNFCEWTVVLENTNKQPLDEEVKKSIESAAGKQSSCLFPSFANVDKSKLSMEVEVDDVVSEKFAINCYHIGAPGEAASRVRFANALISKKTATDLESYNDCPVWEFCWLSRLVGIPKFAKGTAFVPEAHALNYCVALEKREKELEENFRSLQKQKNAQDQDQAAGNSKSSILHCSEPLIAGSVRVCENEIAAQALNGECSWTLVLTGKIDEKTLEAQKSSLMECVKPETDSNGDDSAEATEDKRDSETLITCKTAESVFGTVTLKGKAMASMKAPAEYCNGLKKRMKQLTTRK